MDFHLQLPWKSIRYCDMGMGKRLKFISQLDSKQCGLACLAMICQFYNVNYSLEELEERCPSSPQGISLYSLSNCAKNIGFKPTAMVIDIHELKNMTLPCILHWNGNHYVVLHHISKRYTHFEIADPEKGMIKYDFDHFCKHWYSNANNEVKQGIILELTPTDYLDSDRNSFKKDSHSFWCIFRLLKEFKKSLSIIIGGLLIGCILQLLLPFLTQAVVDVALREKSIGLVWLILMGELMIILGNTFGEWIRKKIHLHISMRINIALVYKFFIQLLKLPMSYFDTKLLGDLLQRIRDHSRIETFLTGELLNSLVAVLNLLTFGIVLLIYNNIILIVYITGGICYGLWIIVFLRERKILDNEIFEQEAINQTITFQLITTMQEIKLHNCENRRLTEWEKIQANLFAYKIKSLKLNQRQETGAVIITEITNIVITILAASAVINGHLSIGSMLAIQFIVGQLRSPVEQVMLMIYSIQDVKISLERINEIHQKEPEHRNISSSPSIISSKSIKLTEVDFRYHPNIPKNTLKNISLCIPEGKVTAIVGASGSGKTTLIKLLLGYYKATKGIISISHKNINDYNLKWWRSHCGVVMQDGVIFSDSIERNIAISDHDIDLFRLKQAAKIANIHSFICNLPLKYKTIVGPNGIGLSKGQKQRILIARAVYKNPDFIFLDEATNALDAMNEREIVENLNKFYKGRTVIIVAHRLSTIKNADQILVLDNGYLVESGSHNQLIERKGTYYKLIKNQLELEN